MPYPRIPVLYFDKDGLGPDELALEVANLRKYKPTDTAQLNIRIRKHGMVMRADVDGGYMMDRDTVAELHSQLTQWLSENPAKG